MAAKATVLVSVARGYGFNIVNPRSGKCLDIPGAHFEKGAKVDIWDCNGSGAQDWQFHDDSSIRNPASGMCLDIPGNSGYQDETQIQIWSCNGSGPQQWYRVNSQIKSVSSDKCLDIRNPDDKVPEAGMSVQLNGCWGVGNQEWVVKDAQTAVGSSEPTEPESSDDNGQCGSSAYSFCCAVGTPCDCSKGVTAEGQCQGSIKGLTSYAYCCSFGTPCDCSRPPKSEFNGTLIV